MSEISKIKIHSEYHGEDDSWHIFMDGEQVHVTKEIYQRDMFISELKAKIKLMQKENDMTEDEFLKKADVIYRVVKENIPLHPDNVRIYLNELYMAYSASLQQAETLQKTLEWYADESNYSLEHHAWLPVSEDGGKLAREVLKKYE